MEYSSLFIEKYNNKIDFIKLENEVVYVNLDDLKTLFKHSVKEWFSLPERGKYLKWAVAKLFYESYNCFRNSEQYEAEFYKIIDDKELAAYDLVCRYINDMDVDVFKIVDCYVDQLKKLAISQ